MRVPQKLLRAAGVVRVGFLAWAMHFFATSLLGAEAREGLVFLGDKDYPPIAYLEDAVPRGMDVDLVRALAGALKKEIRVELIDWQLAQQKVLSGEADALLGTSITEERRKQFDFASPSFTREFGFLARKDDVVFQGIKDLAGKKVGVTPGGFPRRFLETRGGVELVLVENYPAGFAGLTDRTIDVLAADLWVAAYLIEKGGIRDVRFVGRPFATAPSALAVQKGNNALLEQINAGLRRLESEGKIQAIQDQWRPKEMVFISRERIRNVIALGAAILAAIVFIVMGVWIFTLKSQALVRQKAEASLRASEERFQLAVRGSADGLWDRNLLTDEVFFADRYRELLGYSREEFPGRVSSFESRLHPADRERVLGLIAAHLKDRQTYDAEYRLLTKSGDYRWFRGRGQAVWDEQGRAIRMAGSITDITEKKRAEEALNLLQAITMDVVAAKDVASALHVVLRRVCEKTGWAMGQAWTPNDDGTALDCCPAWFAPGTDLDEFRAGSKGITFAPGVGLPGRVWTTRQPLWLRDATQDPNFPRVDLARKCGLKAGLGIPILSGDEVISVLEFFLKEPRDEDERFVKVISAIAAQISLAIGRKRAEDQARAWGEKLRALAGRLQAVREEERTTVAREIHDVLAQELTRMKLDLGWIVRRLERSAAGDDAALREKVTGMLSVADAAIGSVQRIATDLRPIILDSLGLAAAIEWQAEEFQSRTGIKCDVTVPDEEIQIPRDAATGLFRIVQESLTNVTRHAGATRVDVDLDVDEGELLLRIHDNGIGIGVTAYKDPRTLGLLGMRERALLLGGQIEIAGAPGKGTTIRVAMPMSAEPLTPAPA